MLSARFINPFILYRSGAPDRFEYELVIMDDTEVIERTSKSYPWTVTDSELEDIGATALSDYIMRTGSTEPQSFAPPALDWPDGGPV